jgi:hypothetical protein
VDTIINSEVSNTGSFIVHSVWPAVFSDRNLIPVPTGFLFIQRVDLLKTHTRNSIRTIPWLHVSLSLIWYRFPGLSDFLTAYSTKQTQQSGLIHSWEAKSHSVKKLPAFYEIGRFITVFTSIHHWCVLLAKLIQSTPSYRKWSTIIVILSSNLHLGVPNDLFPSRFSTKILYAFLISRSAWFLHCLIHPSWLDNSNPPIYV